MIIDGGSCSFGIESTVLKVTHDSKFNLTILRKGGISIDNLTETIRDLGLQDQVSVT